MSTQTPYIPVDAGASKEFLDAMTLFKGVIQPLQDLYNDLDVVAKSQFWNIFDTLLTAKTSGDTIEAQTEFMLLIESEQVNKTIMGFIRLFEAVLAFLGSEIGMRSFVLIFDILDSVFSNLSVAMLAIYGNAVRWGWI